MTFITTELSPHLSCGTDLVDVAHFDRALHASRGRMATICFTDRERQEAAGRSDRLATRWAVKESVSKVLGLGLMRGVGFHDIEVTIGQHGRPTLTLRGAAQQVAVNQGLTEWTISVSHERGLAIAFVVASQHPNHTEFHKSRRTAKCPKN